MHEAPDASVFAFRFRSWRALNRLAEGQGPVVRFPRVQIGEGVDNCDCGVFPADRSQYAVEMGKVHPGGRSLRGAGMVALSVCCRKRVSTKPRNCMSAPARGGPKGEATLNLACLVANHRDAWRECRGSRRRRL
jgi:hypothetical protein